jgi:methylated-DNA-protein-cysteine methyltransferase-like protein
VGTDSALDPDGEGLSPFEEAVIRVLRSTQPGDVMAYGEVAAEAGFPGAARAVGTLLRRFDDLPWWRIVNASGRLVPGHVITQSDLLNNEGVKTRNGRVVAG